MQYVNIKILSEHISTYLNATHISPYTSNNVLRIACNRCVHCILSVYIHVLHVRLPPHTQCSTVHGIFIKLSPRFQVIQYLSNLFVHFIFIETFEQVSSKYTAILSYYMERELVNDYLIFYLNGLYFQ